jgi:hypothetical protein
MNRSRWSLNRRKQFSIFRGGWAAGQCELTLEGKEPLPLVAEPKKTVLDLLDPHYR